VSVRHSWQQATGTGPIDEPRHLDPIERGIEDIARGRAVIVVDDASRENEGDLVFAAEHGTPELVAFMVRHSSGYVCVPMTGADLDRLELPLMVGDNADPLKTAYTVSVDAKDVGTGISAADRCRTIRALSDPNTSPTDLIRPGHILPLRARDGGVLRRAGHTEAAVDLARLSGARCHAGVICELVTDDGSVRRLPGLSDFATQHGLTMISIADLIAYRCQTETHVERLASAAIPTAHGQFTAIAFRDKLDGSEHLALVKGEIGDGQDVLVRVHSECLTGDVLGSQRCDCGFQLEHALKTIAAEGRGVLVYMRGHEGRGIGLGNKLKAYALQEQGYDTVDANLALGLPVDARDYGTGAQILVALGVHTMRLLTNNPTKRAGLQGYGLSIADRVPMPTHVTPENVTYLATKRDRCGHYLHDTVPPNTEPHHPPKLERVGGAD
jgi:3,4-dihydroxy 2-butanone 4-phosphate synthase/GTP cyclohydrolase II